MTSKVVVDAHAGWPVKVEGIDHNLNGETLTVDLGTVEPGAEQEFYLFEGRQLVLTELRRDDQADRQGELEVG